VDSLAGDETDMAPSVHATKEGLTAKADLDAETGKIVLSQIPDLNQMYRGAFTSEAALNLAHPTDVLGAYATVIVDGEPNLYVWNGTAWTDTEVPGVWVESINGQTGPDITLDASDVGAAPASHVTDTDVHVSADERTLLDGLPVTLAGKEDTVNKGAANGYAGLGADGKVPAANLPDVIDGGSA
jgi:hypothetical protein